MSSRFDPDHWDAVRFVFRPLADPDGIPPGIRFRHLLKFALRALYLACVRMEPDEPR